MANTTGWTRFADSSDIQAIINKITTGNNNIGVTTDRGGTNNTGTVMAKLNALIDLSNNSGAVINALRAAYTDARAVNLDRLDTHVSTRADQATANAIKSLLDNYLGLNGHQGAITGAVYNENLHQKCADILNLAQNILNGLNNMIANGLPGDYIGRTMSHSKNEIMLEPNTQYTLLSHNGKGLSLLNLTPTNRILYTLVVDGVTIFNNVDGISLGHGLYGSIELANSSTSNYNYSNGLIPVPYKTGFVLYAKASSSRVSAKAAAFHYN